MPEPNAKVDAIIQLAEAKHIEPSQLDEVVHDTASGLASEANNGGIEGQIRFLCEHVPTTEVAQMIENIKTEGGEPSA